MKNLLFIIFALPTLLGNELISQNEAKIWYFGAQAGLDFNTNPPTILVDGAMNVNEGCASIADSNGSLLFYTDGNTIWNKTHVAMANGSGLYGGFGTTSQAAFIVKKPNSSSFYYVFTNMAQNGANYGLHYSEVNMSLASGNGSVTIKNILLSTATSEKLCGVQHRNTNDIWVVSHEFNSNNFLAYLVSSSGVNTQAVISSAGTNYGLSPENLVGCMKISPDGKKIGLALYSATNTGSFELYDFNNTTGLVSNSLVLGSGFSKAYGCEFSPDGTKFYGACNTNDPIWQWDLCAGSNSALIASKFAISTSTLSGLGAFQLGPDGKIYVDRTSAQSILGIVNNPNLKGNACNFVEFGQSVSPKACGFGLPNFCSSYFKSAPALSITSAGGFSLCSGETKTLTVTGANTFTWNSNYATNSLTISPTITSTYSVVGTVTLTGCKFEEVVTVSVSACTWVEELISSPFLDLYPVPAQNQLRVQLSEDKMKLEYSIKDFTGKTIMTFARIDDHGEIIIDVQDLSNGIYWLYLKFSTGEIEPKKFIITK